MYEVGGPLNPVTLVVVEKSNRFCSGKFLLARSDCCLVIIPVLPKNLSYFFFFHPRIKKVVSI